MTIVSPQQLEAQINSHHHHQHQCLYDLLPAQLLSNVSPKYAYTTSHRMSLLFSPEQLCPKINSCIHHFPSNISLIPSWTALPQTQLTSSSVPRVFVICCCAICLAVTQVCSSGCLTAIGTTSRGLSPAVTPMANSHTWERVIKIFFLKSQVVQRDMSKLFVCVCVCVCAPFPSTSNADWIFLCHTGSSNGHV